jgi:hypothetical protein
MRARLRKDGDAGVVWLMRLKNVAAEQSLLLLNTLEEVASIVGMTGAFKPLSSIILIRLRRISSYQIRSVQVQ